MQQIKKLLRTQNTIIVYSFIYNHQIKNIDRYFIHNYCNAIQYPNIPFDVRSEQYEIKDFESYKETSLLVQPFAPVASCWG